MALYVYDLRINGLEAIKAPPGATLTLTWTPAQGAYRQSIARDNNGSMFSPTYIAQNLDKAANTYQVTAPETGGEYFYFAINTTNNDGSGGFSNRANVQAGTVTPATTPGNVALTSASALPGENVTLSWSASIPGEYSGLTGYEIARSTSPDTVGTVVYTVDAATLQVAVAASSTAGETYYYRVRSVAYFPDGNSEWSEPVSLWAILPPAAPVLTVGANTYNPRPRIFARTGTGEAPLSIAAPGMNISRTEGLANNDGVLMQRVDDIEPGGSATVTAAVTDKYGISTSASVTIQRIVPTWTDNPIVAGETVVKAAHINELRAALDTICDYYDIDRTAWGEEVEAGTTPLYNWIGHATELQDTVRRIAGVINAYDPDSPANRVILPAMPAPEWASAEIINQLRQLITIL